jgi:membrane protein
MPARKRKRHIFARLKRTGKLFAEVDPFTEAASLAFTTVFAIPGVVIIALAVASTFHDAEAVREALYQQAGGFVGEDTAASLREIVEKSLGSESGLFAKVMGGVALVISATAAFASLQGSLNRIWRVGRAPGSTIVRYLLSRAISLGLIAALGFVLLISMVIDAMMAMVLNGVGLGNDAEDRLAGMLGMVISYGTVTLVFALVFKFLPDVRIAWRAVWVGALFTAALFTLGKFLFGLYLAKSDAGSAYGAGGTVVVVLLWVFYSSILMLFGAQYTYVSARERGDRITPAGPIAKFEEPVKKWGA